MATRNSIILTMVLLAGLASAARGAELITNGSFETGTFAGWTATNAPNPWFAWQAAGAGFSNGFSQPAVPQHGSRVAYQGVASEPGTFSLVQQVSIPAGTAALFWRHRFQLDHATFCASCGTATYRVDVLNTSNAVLANLFIMNVGSGQNVNTGWQAFGVSMNAFAGTTVRIRFSTTVTVSYSGPGQLEVDAVSLQAPFTSTAAKASISGTVTDHFGRSVSNAVVTVSDERGQIRRVSTNTFGRFSLADLEVGQTYVISISHRRYRFVESSRIVDLTENFDDLNFFASP